MKEFTADERIVRDRMLSELARRLDGAVDTWTSVGWLNSPYCQEFLWKNVDILRAILTVTAAFWQPATDEVHSLLKSMLTSYGTLASAFQVLEHFRTCEIEELRTATGELAQVYSKWHEAIRQLAKTIDLEVTYLHTRTPERQEYFKNILNMLFELCCTEREKR
jgi:hypothetical protein